MTGRSEKRTAMSPDRNPRAHTSGSGVARSSEPDIPAADSKASAPPDGPTTEDATTDSGGKQAPPPRPDTRADTRGLALIGPTSEATRRMVAESRARQGLTPYINDPYVIESLALFLRHALDTLDRDNGREHR